MLVSQQEEIKTTFSPLF